MLSFYFENLLFHDFPFTKLLEPAEQPIASPRSSEGKIIEGDNFQNYGGKDNILRLQYFHWTSVKLSKCQINEQSYRQIINTSRRITLIISESGYKSISWFSVSRIGEKSSFEEWYVYQTWVIIDKLKQKHFKSVTILIFILSSWLFEIGESSCQNLKKISTDFNDCKGFFAG